MHEKKKDLDFGKTIELSWWWGTAKTVDRQILWKKALSIAGMSLMFPYNYSNSFDKYFLIHLNTMKNNTQ
jgi:hypothetical protein